MKMYPRTNPAPFGASENSNVIPAPQIEEALRESVRQNAAHIRHEPENTSQVVTDVNLFVQRVAGVSLDQLDDAIVDLRQLSCTTRANEYKRKSRAICSSTTLPSTQQKVLSITSCNGKRRRIVPRALPSEVISWAQRFRRRRPRPADFTWVPPDSRSQKMAVFERRATAQPHAFTSCPVDWLTEFDRIGSWAVVQAWLNRKF
jgi:hypothetical protein